ncbi:kelch protein 5 [Echinococcus multilocularis]|uniref:Kelch protein 5 n=1 Tax=Echinococcus multilocularis TaxID=6211 RepID=A0A068Y565_ECHMU|nr:kelch protein 5 [Echinococcus multilocularis]
MATVQYSDENAGSSLSHKFCLLREMSKLIDLRIATEDGNYVEAHRLIVAASIVEAAINYAYTGSITISAANVTRIYLLAHNLGSDTIVKWCADFLKTRWVKLFWELQPTVRRISLDNVSEVWSVANVTLNRELMELCIPLTTEHFEILCLRSKMLVRTTAEYFEVLLEKGHQRGVSEETKFQTISKWLAAGATLPNPAMKSEGDAMKRTPRLTSNCPPRCKYINHFS